MLECTCRISIYPAFSAARPLARVTAFAALTSLTTSAQLQFKPSLTLSMPPQQQHHECKCLAYDTGQAPMQSVPSATMNQRQPQPSQLRCQPQVLQYTPPTTSGLSKMPKYSFLNDNVSDKRRPWDAGSTKHHPWSAGTAQHFSPAPSSHYKITTASRYAPLLAC